MATTEPESLADAEPTGPRELEEERDFLLRSLADLEAEHDAHDIDDVDYETLKDDYTARAAAVLRALAAPPEVDPAAADASGMPAGSVDGDVAVLDTADRDGSDHDTEGHLGADGAGTVGAGRGRPAGWLGRHRKMVVSAIGVAIVLAGVLWSVTASSGQRQAGQPITGDPVGPAGETKLLLAAQAAANRGDNVTELKDAQKILASDPTQPQALTMEGWLLAQTGQKALRNKGLGLLSLAEQVDPSFKEPHVYRGIAFLAEGDNRDAVPELRWYLAHQPDPKLAPKVKAALAKAEAALAKG